MPPADSLRAITKLDVAVVVVVGKQSVSCAEAEARCREAALHHRASSGAGLPSHR